MKEHQQEEDAEPCPICNLETRTVSCRSLGWTMEDSSEDRLTTRSLLKGILATEPLRTAVKRQSRNRVHQRPSTSYVHQDENSSSPSRNLRSKMRERVRHSLGKSALEASIFERNVATNSKTKPKSAKKESHPIMEDLDKITPRTLLKKIIQNEDEVSILVSQRSKASAADNKKQEDTPTAKLSSVSYVNLSLPDLQDTEDITAFRKPTRKKKIRVSEFEREVDARLPKNREDEVSILVSQRSKASAADNKKQEDTPTAKLSSVSYVNLSLPDLQDTERITALRKSTRKRKIRVSEFEREVDARLPKNRDYNISSKSDEFPSLFVDSYTKSGSIENKLDISAAPESTSTRGLLRRPNKIFLVSLGEFEQGVEDKYQLLKGSQECFIEPVEEDKYDSSSNEVAQMNTELYAQSLHKEANTPRQRGTSKLFLSTYDESKEGNYKLLGTETRKPDPNYQPAFQMTNLEQYTNKDIGGEHGEGEVNEDSGESEASKDSGEGEASKGSGEGEANEDSGEEVEVDDDHVDDDDGANVDSGEDGANVDSGEDGANVDSGEGEANVDSGEGEANVDSGEGEANVDSGEGEANVDSGEGEANVDSGESEANVDRGEVDEDSGEEVEVDDDHVDDEDSGEDGANVDSGEDEANVDSGEGEANDSGEEVEVDDHVDEDSGEDETNEDSAEEVDDDHVEGEVRDDVKNVGNFIQKNESRLTNSNRKSTGIGKYSSMAQNARLGEENGMQRRESINVDTVSVSRPDNHSESSESSENMDLAQNTIDREKKKENKQLMFSALTQTPAYIKFARFTTDKPPVRKNIQRKKSTKPKKQGSGFSISQVKQIFRHHAQVRVSNEAFADVEKCLELYLKQLTVDLSAYTAHANRKTITRADMELLMKRQRLVTDTTPLNVLIERHLPLESRALLIPCAHSGNKVIPRK
ncbi:centromere protein T isoform X2 [Rhinoderma darwinii]|uniref:centromere protein T isoform X2 n=1 Tax=Rhinoderma darwinii TaxID=43563 RepID=UPI003F668246